MIEPCRWRALKLGIEVEVGVGVFAAARKMWQGYLDGAGCRPVPCTPNLRIIQVGREIQLLRQPRCWKRACTLACLLCFILISLQQSQEVTFFHSKVYFIMLLEEQRYIAEDLERLEQGIADRMGEEPKQVR